MDFWQKSGTPCAQKTTVVKKIALLIIIIDGPELVKKPVGQLHKKTKSLQAPLKTTPKPFFAELKSGKMMDISYGKIDQLLMILNSCFSGLLGFKFDPTQKKIQTSMKACLEIKREIALQPKKL